ncbi:MAG: hypothetical protein R3F11_31595 [Verrucomicrobiales bacterium]
MISSIESTHEGSGDGDVPARLEPDRWVEQHGEAMRAYALGFACATQTAADPSKKPTPLRSSQPRTSVHAAQSGRG